VLPSNKDLDLLGESIRADTMTPADWMQLHSMRGTWRIAFIELQATLRQSFESRNYKVTGRLKNYRTIREKLIRSNLRLSKIRDIVGCRIVIPNSLEIQDLVVGQILALHLNSDFRVIDRRVLPNHGYRAVHIELRRDGLISEVQVRTQVQDLWATTSEAFGEFVGRGFRYGQGLQLEQFSAGAKLLIQRISTGLDESSQKIGEVGYDLSLTALNEIAEIEQQLFKINSLISETDWSL
jgi:ppGpp synthetase/RelA/SpoT-type nucleotidyltranferase